VDSPAGPSHIAVARISRTRGIRGEVLADLHTDFPERFGLLHRVWVELPDGKRLSLVLERCWWHQGRPVLKFSGIDTITAAEPLVGGWVEVEAGETVALPDGMYWDRELEGCRVIDRRGEKLGVVTSILRIAANSQLVVQGEDGEFLIPLVAAFCREISVERREILVELPEGLMDLNR